jgi:multiple antibiotic resistance protein
MEIAWAEYSRFAIALLVIVDPLAAIPLFLQLTDGFSLRERKRTARVTAAAVFGVLAGAALAGESILGVFGTSLAAFRVGGGIVLLLMALSMLTAEPDRTRHTPEEDAASRDKSSVAVVPLGVPLLAGPGAISAVILQANTGAGVLHRGLVLAIIGVLGVACWLALRNAERIGRWIGPIGMNVVIRLFGLILAAIGVEFIAAGVKELFPGIA